MITKLIRDLTEDEQNAVCNDYFCYECPLKTEGSVCLPNAVDDKERTYILEQIGDNTVEIEED